MTDLPSSIEVLKVDVAGRVRTPKEKREEIVAAYRRSGMTGRQFAQYSGVKYPTLMSWVGKAGGNGSVPDAAGLKGIQWVEARVEGSGEALVVEIGGAVKMEVVNSRQAGLAAEVIRGLGMMGKPC